MKYRESGMPDENLWDTFFDSNKIIDLMGIDEKINVLIDIGCGYGTFLFPASKIVKIAIGIDIDLQMIEYCTEKTRTNNYKNIKLILGDISQKETLKDLKPYINQIEYVTLFNILHCEEPVQLLESVINILKKDGKVGIIHWKYEKTPRGPSMEIRPRPEKIKEWANSAGFKIEKQIDLPPFHYGIVLKK